MKKLVTACLALSTGLFAAGWEIFATSGEHDHPGVIRLVQGVTQSISFELKTDDINAISAEKWHDMKATLLLPDNMTFVTSVHGDQQGETHDVTVAGNTVTDSYRVYRSMFGAVGKSSEWKTYKIAVRVPVDGGKDDKLALRFDHKGVRVAEKTYAIEYMPPLVPAPRLKYLKVNFWDYGEYMLVKAQPELVRFWKAAGFNGSFGTISNPGCTDFEIMGDVHHAAMETMAYPSFNARGDKVTIGLDGWYLKSKSISDILPKLSDEFIKQAKANGTMITGVDYEPTGIEDGFIPESVQAFKKEYQISDADFKAMQDLIAQHGFDFIRKATGEQRETFVKWNSYQSKLNAEFMRKMVADLKAKDPSVRFCNTTLDALPAPDSKGTGLGADASLQAPFLDRIEPQLYCGYDEVAAKYVILRTAQWRRRLQELNCARSCKLNPLLILRYCKGEKRNNPAYLRQQTIGAFAEGAQGVGFYYIQAFDGEDWQALADTVRLLAPVEEFYAKGLRCDHLFQVSGAPARNERFNVYPAGDMPVPNPDWHITAHCLDGKILVTLFNISQKAPMTVRLDTDRAFDAVLNGAEHTADGAFAIQPSTTAFLLFK